MYFLRAVKIITSQSMTLIDLAFAFSHSFVIISSVDDDANQWCLFIAFLVRSACWYVYLWLSLFSCQKVEKIDNSHETFKCLHSCFTLLHSKFSEKNTLEAL